jgi:AcrR family transcriptional regulator
MTKKRILDVASHIFSEYGYAGANMRMIAGSANIGVSSLYLYFNNKEDLYLILMKSWMDDFSDKTMGYVKNIHDPSKAISAFITISINYAKKHPALILLQGQEHGTLFLEMKREFFRKQRNLIENIIRQGMRSGAFRDVNVKETAQIIFSVVRGFYLSVAVEPDSPFSSEKCSELILNGLVKRDKK